MIRFNKIVLFITTALLLAWLLPWGYHFITAEPQRTPFTLYSSVIDQFAMTGMDENGLNYRDKAGNIYTERQFDSILPMFYYRQLIADERFPTQLKGVELNPKLVQQENFIFRHAPANVNVTKPALYPLLESMSGKVDLKMPDDVFRLGNRIEFIDMETNRVNGEKSLLFNEALLKKGVKFPIRSIYGNPTTRKEYDEGYFLVDDAWQVFHFKQVKGRPFVRNTGITPDLKVNYFFPTEFRNRKFFGLLTDQQNNLYILKTKTYELQKLPITGFDPERYSMTIIGDLFNWTVQVGEDNKTAIYAIDAMSYELADTLNYPVQESVLSDFSRYLFPFEITLTSYDDLWVYPRIAEVSFYAVGLNFLLAVICLMRIRRRNIGFYLPVLIGVLIGGLFVFIPAMLFIKRSKA